MKDLAERYGTPLYVYRLDRIRQAADGLRRCLPEGAELFYSLKANPHHRLVGELTARGLRPEISSTGELAAAVRAGAPAGSCLYTGPGKTAQEIRAAVAAGVRLFSVESPTEHRRLAEAAAECGTDVEYLLRINADRTGGGTPGLRMTGTASQFGIPPETALRHPDLFRPTARARPVGLHFYPATNITDPAALAAEFEASIETAGELLARTGLEASLVDLGGGFAAPFAAPGDLPDYRTLRQRLTTALDSHLPGWRHGRPAIAFESGRHLVGPGGTLVTTVLDVKESRGRTYAVLDAGTHTLGGMSGLGRIMAPAATPLTPAGAPSPDRFCLVGPLCTPLDVLNRSVPLPPLRAGDVLEIPNAGAYGLTASLLGFLGRPVAAEVVVDDGVVRHARRLVLHETEIEGDHHG